MTAPQRLARPRLAAVVSAARGRPASVGEVPVDSVLEEWLVEDRWWTPRPIRRRYFELAMADGRCIVVFRNLATGRWYTQRG